MSALRALDHVVTARRAGAHELFLSTVRRFAYARRVVHRGHSRPVYPELAALAWRGEDAIARGDLEAFFVLEDAIVAEVRRILETSKKAAWRRHYWLQLNHAWIWVRLGEDMRRLTYREKMAAMRRKFGVSVRQVERDIAELPDKTRM